MFDEWNFVCSVFCSLPEKHRFLLLALFEVEKVHVKDGHFTAATAASRPELVCDRSMDTKMFSLH